ncbi:MAG TPA: FkbM family methyltransferase [Bryobacteraceae bacterium]|nr:FkbM family methyltransferase [Bryobacteraceae bacterium]
MLSRIAKTVIGFVPASLIALISRNQWRSPLLRKICVWGASFVKSRDGEILHGVGKGLRFNVSNSHSGFLLGSHEAEVQKVLAAILKPGMTYYDVGANVGFFAVIAARLIGPTGHVVCFEPLPANAQQIEYNSKLNGFSNVLTRCEALGGSDRIESFSLSAEPTWGSLATVCKAPDQPHGQMQVTVRALDALCGPGGLPLPDLMKIDVEGAEEEMLLGAMATIRGSRPVLIIELHQTNAAVAAVLDKLNYGYAVLGSSTPVREVAWDANIIAAPKERRDLLPFLTESAHSPVSA